MALFQTSVRQNVTRGMKSLIHIFVMIPLHLFLQSTALFSSGIILDNIDLRRDCGIYLPQQEKSSNPTVKLDFEIRGAPNQQ